MQEILITDGDQKIKLKYETTVWKQNKISGNVSHGLIRLKLPATSLRQQQRWAMQFFNRNQTSILRLLRVYYQHEKFNLGTQERSGFIFLFGRRHFLRYSSTTRTLRLSWPVCYLNQRYQLRSATGLDLSVIESKKRNIYQILIKQNSDYFSKRVFLLASKMNVDITNLKIEVKIFKAHWGKFCGSASQKIIRFNIWLIHFPVATIDYVVIHELTHLAHPHLNHGHYCMVNFSNSNDCLSCAKAQRRAQTRKDSLFWSYVRRYCPNFITHIHRLNHASGVG